MSTITQEDITYLAGQSSEKLNLILSGMTMLMGDTDEKVSLMESQNWFQRMIKTISGKNKMTQEEIKQNHDKLNAYMSEAIAELYDRNCIDHRVIISLGTQLNEIYADHVQLKQILGSFVEKLNEKINSVDNFNMLITEIDQGVYTQENTIYSMCMVMSLLDGRILADDRKLDIIRRSLEKQNILNDDEVTLISFMKHILEIPYEDAGKIYLELSTIRENFLAKVMLQLIESYDFLPDIARKMKNKEAVIDDVVNAEGLDSSISLSSNEVYNDLLNSKIEVSRGLSQLEEKAVNDNTEEKVITSEEVEQSDTDAENDLLKKAEALYLDCELDKAFDIFKKLAEQGNSRAMYYLGEYYEEQHGHVAQNKIEAKKWRLEGYKKGDPLATLNSLDYLDDKLCYSTVLPMVEDMASNGDVVAQYELAKLYLGDTIVDKNSEMGMKWLKTSADGGFWTAIDMIGGLYLYGEIVERDYSMAKMWITVGMEKESAFSFYMAGISYFFGLGTNQDWNKTYELLMKSYRLGCGEAAYMLGELSKQGFFYQDGNFILSADDPNYIDMFSWMEKAAELREEEALVGLGISYYLGLGTEKNISKAVSHCKLASEQGYNKATVMLIIMAFEKCDYKEARKQLDIAKANGCVASDIVEVLCDMFLTEHAQSDYKCSDYLRKSLKIADDEDVYLANDESFFKTGGYGFAIGKSGIFYKGYAMFTDAPVEVTSYKSFASCNQIRVSGAVIYADEKGIAYISNKDKKDMFELYKTMLSLLKFYYY